MSSVKTRWRNLKVWLTKPALVREARRGNLSKVQAILAMGTDVDTRDGYRRTALMEACRMGHVEIVKVLLDYGADISAFSLSGKTPMHYAEDPDVLRLLLEAQEERVASRFNENEA